MSEHFFRLFRTGAEANAEEQAGKGASELCGAVGSVLFAECEEGGGRQLVDAVLFAAAAA